MLTIYIAVWDDEGELNAQAYGTAEAARRDFPDATVIESTLQDADHLQLREN